MRLPSKFAAIAGAMALVHFAAAQNNNLPPGLGTPATTTPSESSSNGVDASPPPRTVQAATATLGEAQVSEQRQSSLLQPSSTPTSESASSVGSAASSSPTASTASNVEPPIISGGTSGPTNSTGSNSPAKSGSHSNGGLIGGIVGGVLGGLILLAIILFICFRHRNKKARTADMEKVKPDTTTRGMDASAAQYEALSSEKGSNAASSPLEHPVTLAGYSGHAHEYPMHSAAARPVVAGPPVVAEPPVAAGPVSPAYASYAVDHPRQPTLPGSGGYSPDSQHGSSAAAHTPSSTPEQQRWALETSVADSAFERQKARAHASRGSRDITSRPLHAQDAPDQAPPYWLTAGEEFGDEKLRRG